MGKFDKVLILIYIGIMLMLMLMIMIMRSFGDRGLRIILLGQPHHTYYYRCHRGTGKVSLPVPIDLGFHMPKKSMFRCLDQQHITDR